MGNFCCCFGSKPKKSTSQTKRLKELSPLKRAKLMKKTMNGKDINQEIHTKLISRAQQNLLRKTTYELDVLLSEPYNLFSKITDNLFLTGVGGINAENIKDNNIKHIINVTYELPIYNVPGVESIKIPVKICFDKLSLIFSSIDRSMTTETKICPLISLKSAIRLTNGRKIMRTLLSTVCVECPALRL